MRSFVYVERGLLCEALETDVALVGPLARVRAVVYLQVLLAGEGRGTREALERSPLHCGGATPSVSHRSVSLLR